MDNVQVNCDVCECAHNEGCNNCSLSSIHITHTADQNAVSTPHFCKSFEKKQ